MYVLGKYIVFSQSPNQINNSGDFLVLFVKLFLMFNLFAFDVNLQLCALHARCKLVVVCVSHLLPHAHHPLPPSILFIIVKSVAFCFQSPPLLVLLAPAFRSCVSGQLVLNAVTS